MYAHSVAWCLDLLRTFPLRIKVVGPTLHHESSCLKVTSAVVSPSVWIFHCVCKLMLNELNPFAQDFIEHRSGGGAKTVRSMRITWIA